MWDDAEAGSLKAEGGRDADDGKGVPMRVLAWPSSLRSGARGVGEVGVGMDVVIPIVGRARRGREKGLNELAWRLAWVGAKRVGGRKVLLQRCCEFFSFPLPLPFFVFFFWGGGLLMGECGCDGG